MLNWLGNPSAFYIYVLYWYLVVGIVVCKASVLNWLKGLDLVLECSGMQGIYGRFDWGIHLPSIYLHCTISSSGCNGMQCKYAELMGVHLSSIYMHCTRSSTGCSSMQGICAQWIEGSRPSIGCSVMQGICGQMAGGLDLAVGVVVFKASLLNWLGGPSVFYIYAFYYI